MSILIKGMEMPKNCFDCPYFNDEYCRCQTGGNWDKGAVYESPPDWCPLIPIPSHGRLIDADELIEHAWRDKLDSRELIAGMIDSASTIIPASEEGQT